LSPSHPWVIGTFVAAIVLWTWRMIRAFARPRQE
jgi:hypothetical protein